jgi:hypothetical protein
MLFVKMQFRVLAGADMAAATQRHIDTSRVPLWLV